MLSIEKIECQLSSNLAISKGVGLVLCLFWVVSGFVFGLLRILFVYLEALVVWVSFVCLMRFALSLCT
jgi:hypothetical protein